MSALKGAGGCGGESTVEREKYRDASERSRDKQQEFESSLKTIHQNVNRSVSGANRLYICDIYAMSKLMMIESLQGLAYGKLHYSSTLLNPFFLFFCLFQFFKMK